MACVFYAPQLLVGTVQYDGVDVHYSSQRYFSDAIRAGHLPFWTPYLFAGFPFLADLQVGAWYPLNWPFFLLGIVPGSIGGELLLHGLIACGGAYALAMRLIGRPPAAVAAGMFYGLSGYFAAHAQHIGMFETAAWLPWLLVLLDALGQRVSLRRLALAGLLGAAVALPGHFQVALYTFSGAGVWAIGEALARRNVAVAGRRALGLLVAAVWGGLLSAVMVLPALELVGQSIRTQLDAAAVDIGYFHPEALLTLVQPDHFGLLSGKYTGPGDVTQHYFYAGIVLVPLVLVGLRTGRIARTALLLGLPFLWYALGPAAGLFRVVARLPGFHSVELPMHGWFLPALGLALLGGAGFARFEASSPRPWLAVAVLVVMFADVLVFNELHNPLAFARLSFDELYARPLRAFDAQVAAARPPVERVYGPPLTAVGYRNHPLQSRVETTYGYNPLELLGYAAYADAAESNPRLIDGLAATHRLSVGAGGAVSLEPNPSALPLAYFARHVTPVPDEPAARARLADLDPSEATIVVGAVPAGLEPDSTANGTALDRQPGQASPAALQREGDSVAHAPVRGEDSSVAYGPVRGEDSSVAHGPVRGEDDSVASAQQRSANAVTLGLQSDSVTIGARGDDSLTLHYRADAAGLIRVAVAAYPGWQAALNGQALPILTVDDALLGVVVPAGEGDVSIWYAPRLFWPAAAMSLLAALACLAALAAPPIIRRLRPEPASLP
jgi:Bacterial membrane protein YfhO